jgi:hypothetical protein
VLLHPPAHRLFKRHVRQRHHTRLGPDLQCVGVALAHCRVIEGETAPVLGDHVAQFTRQHLKQGCRIALRGEQV